MEKNLLVFFKCSFCDIKIISTLHNFWFVNKISVPAFRLKKQTKYWTTLRIVPRTISIKIPRRQSRSPTIRYYKTIDDSKRSPPSARNSSRARTVRVVWANRPGATICPRGVYMYVTRGEAIHVCVTRNYLRARCMRTISLTVFCFICAPGQISSH